MLAQRPEDKMIRLLGFIALLTIAGLMLVPSAAGTPEMAKKESKSCVTCHTAVGKPDLNEAGKYYKEHNNSFEGYEKKPPSK